MTLADYHIHTKLCRHAEGEMEEYVQAAILAGLEEVGFSDHAPVLDDYDPVHRMTWDDFPTYCNTVQHLKEKYSQITIRLGVEADVYPGFERSLEILLKSCPIEYVIGSVHFMDGEAVFKRPDSFPTSKENEAFVHKYFERLTHGVRSGLFDVVAHTDVVKWNFADFKGLIHDLAGTFLESVRDAGMAIELNTSGLRKKPCEMYPSRQILEIASRSSIPVILGSDAHRPEEVAANFEEAVALLHGCSYKNPRRMTKNLMAFQPYPV